MRLESWIFLCVCVCVVYWHVLVTDRVEGVSCKWSPWSPYQTWLLKSSPTCSLHQWHYSDLFMHLVLMSFQISSLRVFTRHRCTAVMNSGAKKYLVSHWLCKFSYLEWWERNFHRRYTLTMRDIMKNKIQEITL